VVLRLWRGQGVPAHHAFGVFAAIEVQQLQSHRLVPFGVSQGVAMPRHGLALSLTGMAPVAGFRDTSSVYFA
jgi:hypothetical protein